LYQADHFKFKSNVVQIQHKLAYLNKFKFNNMLQSRQECLLNLSSTILVQAILFVQFNSIIYQPTLKI